MKKILLTFQVFCLALLHLLFLYRPISDIAPNDQIYYGTLAVYLFVIFSLRQKTAALIYIFCLLALWLIYQPLSERIYKDKAPIVISTEYGTVSPAPENHSLPLPQDIPSQRQTDYSPICHPIVSDWLNANSGAGLVTGIYNNGDRWIAGFGHSDHDNELSGPPDSTTIFQIGSVSKTFTASLLAQAVSAGKMQLNDSVVFHLPAGVMLPTGHERAITLADLACHYSGLPRLPDNLSKNDPENPYAYYTASDMYNYLSKIELLTRPGSHYEYSNLGYALLGCCLTERSGKTFAELIHEHIAGPLAMPDTCVTLSTEQQSRLIQGLAPVDSNGKRQWQKNAPWQMGDFAATGGLYSTADDLMQFLAANIELPANLEFLESTRAVQHNVSDNLSVALAWHIIKSPTGLSIYQHSGLVGGYASFIAFEPQSKSGIFILANAAISVDVPAMAIFDKILSKQ
ncbi:MAG: beta-lactamase family protein [Sedimentisphaerales bacterium]|nr:beta-lactamase family protein [Sedimentisphaerales bacterium]MBN2843714.1 beta-lactamase family protein [Sedimentisphaerales bacterium]